VLETGCCSYSVYLLITRFRSESYYQPVAESSSVERLADEVTKLLAKALASFRTDVALREVVPYLSAVAEARRPGASLQRALRNLLEEAIGAAEPASYRSTLSALWGVGGHYGPITRGGRERRASEEWASAHKRSGDEPLRAGEPQYLSPNSIRSPRWRDRFVQAMVDALSLFVTDAAPVQADLLDTAVQPPVRPPEPDVARLTERGPIGRAVRETSLIRAAVSTEGLLNKQFWLQSYALGCVNRLDEILRKYRWFVYGQQSLFLADAEVVRRAWAKEISGRHYTSADSLSDLLIHLVRLWAATEDYRQPLLDMADAQSNASLEVLLIRESEMIAIALKAVETAARTQLAQTEKTGGSKSRGDRQRPPLTSFLSQTQDLLTNFDTETWEREFQSHQGINASTLFPASEHASRRALATAMRDWQLWFPPSADAEEAWGRVRHACANIVAIIDVWNDTKKKYRTHLFSASVHDEDQVLGLLSEVRVEDGRRIFDIGDVPRHSTAWEGRRGRWLGRRSR
jgi:hypothetical protein